MSLFKKIFFVLALSFVSVHAGDFLMPDEAFKPYAKTNDKMQIIAGITIGDEIYLYDEALKIKLTEGNGLSIKKIDKPAPVQHNGDAVYLKSPQFIITLKNGAGVGGVRDVGLSIAYQGCSEKGLCYEPTTKVFKLKIDTAKLQNTQSVLQPLLTKQTNTVEKKVALSEKSQTDRIADTIKTSSFLVVLFTFFVFGLLLSLTPCVFPMIPIISGVIISQGEGLTTKKAFALSLVYVLAMAVAYTIAGVLAGLFGSNLQAALQAPWVVYSFAAVFVALAFSMFGFYELKLPDTLVAKVSSKSNRGGFIGVAVMGFLSALIVGPCVAAPLAGALVYIGQTGDALLGGSALFAMSIGMGLPLIIVGVSAGKFMPKPGPWMTMVNAVFGVMMLGVAIWMLGKILPSDIIMLLFSLLGIGFGLYLGAFEKEGHIFKKSLAVIIFIYSVALFIGFLGGGSNMLKPLSFLQAKGIANASEAPKSLNFKVVTSLKELDKLLASNKGKKIMLDFSADWCTACKELEEVTFSNTKVINALDEYVLIRADLTKNTQSEKELSQKYGVFGPPAVLFFDTDGRLLPSKTIIGFVEPEEFLSHLKE